MGDGDLVSKGIIDPTVRGFRCDRRGDASDAVSLLVVAAAWLVNQGFGFELLHYPIDRTTILWGLTIGAAALAATVAATWILSALPRAAGITSLGLAFIGAYAAYEIVLYAATPILGSAGAFTASIVARLAILNVLWTMGL